MQEYNEPGFVNIGTGKDLTIKDLALLIKKVIGFEGTLTFDSSKPDGTPRKLMDICKSLPNDALIDIKVDEQKLAQINAIMQSDMWQDTAIFLTWDEWGGFYDPIVPPAIAPQK